MDLGPWAMGLTGLGPGLGLVFMELGWADLMILEPMANTALQSDKVSAISRRQVSGETGEGTIESLRGQGPRAAAGERA